MSSGGLADDAAAHRGWVARLEEGLVALLLAAMTLITFMQVVARYVFNYSFVWALELTTFLFGGLIFLGMSYGVRVGAHIGIDALTRLMSPRIARGVAIVATLLCIVYASIVLVGGWIYVGKIRDIGILAQDMPIAQWIPRAVLPVGYALLLLRFGQVLFRLITGKEAHLLGDEAQDAMHLLADEDGDANGPQRDNNKGPGDDGPPSRSDVPPGDHR